MKRFILFLVFLSAYSIGVYATHNRAGEITYRQIGPLTLEVTVTTYTKSSSIDADRDELTVDWGDGFQDTIRRDSETFLPNDTKKNTYTDIHQYPALGTYTISMTDPNRNAGIININNGISVIIPFYIQTTFTFLNPQFQGDNNSPILLQPPIDFGCVGQIFKHNPNAFDPDGDSLAYELITPLEGVGQEVPDYEFPDQVMPIGNDARLDPITGDFIWITPQQEGEYNIAILIKEYRNGRLINSMIRDMQIFIDRCQNVPPRVEAPEEICVIAGETIEFEVTAEAPLFEMDQLVKLTALGGPFSLDNAPARFDVSNNFENDPLVGRFVWETNCNHIRKEPYTMVFRAVDNYYDTTGLTDLKTVRVKVMGPPPEDPLAEFNNNRVEISWKQPYICENADENYFRGFSVWRRIGSNPFVPDSCIAGLEGQGYQRIAFNLKDFQNSRYFFNDTDDLERGISYCYRILGEFAQQTADGLPYNPVSSIPSMEVCIQIGRDLPFITKVDVAQTDVRSGSIELTWTKPVAEDLDTLQNPGPYVYQILRAVGIDGTDFIEIPNARFTHQSYGENHTLDYIDSNINTISQGYNYTVQFFVAQDEELGNAPAASSIFLEIAPTDKKNLLRWSLDVPWTNFKYYIHRFDEQIQDFVLIDSTENLIYTDSNLINGQEYCYFIQSFGSYGLNGLEDTLINRSQEVCAIPIDNVPPCAPILTVDNFCLNDNLNEIFSNFLSWSDPRIDCNDNEDLYGYRIYYSAPGSTSFNIIEEIELADERAYEHERGDSQFSGCYFLTSFDSLDNESLALDTICLQNCPNYQLPNTFTPNGDRQNDIYVPTQSKFIARVEMKIFNRWGNLIFQTEDPEINWDGTNQKNGDPLPDATYFYVCKVFQQDQGGTQEQDEVLTGFIDLIR